jgi:hypothetical protein
MLSMVNANRFINTFAILLVMVAYAVFLWIDHNHNNQVDPANKDHVQSIRKIGNIDGLVFGGSNAIYSLSAESLNYYTGIRWYNASVIQELWTIKRHKDFIRDLSARIDRTKVRYVVYSSIFPYWTGVIRSRENLGIRIKPKVSVLGYILQTSRNLKFPQRNRFGDVVFESVKCDFTAEYTVKHQREDENISVGFLADYAIFFASLFPNASILIVLPSEYYGALSFDDSIFEQSLRTKFYNILNGKYFKNTTVKIIFQPPYSSITQVCDEQYHANEGGRLWRTRNLIEFMR